MGHLSESPLQRKRLVSCIKSSLGALIFHWGWGWGGGGAGWLSILLPVQHQFASVPGFQRGLESKYRASPQRAAWAGLVPQ